MKFQKAVEHARAWQGWTIPEIAERLDVSADTVRSWLKPAATSRREAPSWAGFALYALATGQPTKERRGALVITYAPATGRGRP